MSNEIESLCILPNGFVVFKECGNPSGSFMTLVRNTFQNFRLYAYVYIEACKNLGVEPSYDRYFSNHVALMNGDDCIITSSKLMNFSLIKEHMTKFLSITSISYRGRHEVPLEQATYCGCTPFDYDYQYVPLRNSYKLLLSLYFQNESEDKLPERLEGLLNANPFDDYFVNVLYYIAKKFSIALVDVDFIRSRFLIKEGVSRVKSVTQKENFENV
jgi:hypothetical protein